MALLRKSGLQLAGQVSGLCVYSHGSFTQVMSYGLQGTERFAQRPRLGPFV